MTETATAPRIYVASLSDYNAGRLHGRWIDATQDAEDIHAEVAEMLKASPEPGAEEWAIHDFEGFEGIRLSEYESFETVSALADALAEHGAAFAAYHQREDEDGDIADRVEAFTEAFAGEWDSEEAYAEEYVSDLGWGDVPAGELSLGHNGYREVKVNAIESLLPYLDMEMIAREVFGDGSHYSVDRPGGVYVFRNL